MGIELFKAITTEEHLVALEKEAITYQELWVDMEDADSRKFVKEKASLVSSMLKKVDRTRIDITREFKVKVDKEAESITSRLNEVNRPFTLLIDEHKAERQKVLDAEKTVQAAKDLIIQIANDHDEAILFNKVFAFERAEQIRIQAERDDLIRKEASEQATQRAEQVALEAIERADSERRMTALKAEQDERAKQAEITRRQNDKDHKRDANIAAKNDFMMHGISSDDAEKIIKLIASKLISNIVINY